MSNENDKLDLERMLGAMRDLLASISGAQERFFATARKLSELKIYADSYSKNSLYANIYEQTAVMELAVKLGEKQKQICQKYGWVDENEED